MVFAAQLVCEMQLHTPVLCYASFNSTFRLTQPLKLQSCLPSSHIFQWHSQWLLLHFYWEACAVNAHICVKNKNKQTWSPHLSCVSWHLSKPALLFVIRQNALPDIHKGKAWVFRGESAPVFAIYHQHRGDGGDSLWMQSGIMGCYSLVINIMLEAKCVFHHYSEDFELEFLSLRLTRIT